jgi:hypothetical protein
MNQKWGNCEKKIQRLEDIINFNSLKERLILPNQMSKKGHYCKIVANEMPIKIGESKKTLNITNEN